MVTGLSDKANLEQERLEAVRLVETKVGTEMRWQRVSNEFSSHLFRLAEERLAASCNIRVSPCLMENAFDHFSVLST
jgi:hypothetical protein